MSKSAHILTIVLLIFLAHVAQMSAATLGLPQIRVR